MVEKLQKMRKNKKGFTLVELIVVLVILAILIALLIPALTGYIDKANQKKCLAEARNAVMAAQTYSSEEYAKGTAEATVEGKINGNATTSEACKLGEVTGTVSDTDVDASGKVVSLKYTMASGGLSTTYTKGSSTSYSEPTK